MWQMCLSRSVGSGGFGTRYVYPQDGALAGDDGNGAARTLPVDLAANARSLGAHAIAANDIPQLKSALAEARRQKRSTVIVIETDVEKRAPGYESWWDVPVSEVASVNPVKAARKGYEESKKKERRYL